MTTEGEADRPSRLARRRPELLAAVLIAATAIPPAAVGAALRSEPIPEGCFEWCNLGHDTGTLISYVAVAALALAVGATSSWWVQGVAVMVSGLVAAGLAVVLVFVSVVAVAGWVDFDASGVAMIAATASALGAAAALLCRAMLRSVADEIAGLDGTEEPSDDSPPPSDERGTG